MRLIIARHGQTEWNLHSRTQGMTETSLTRRGMWQIERLAGRISKIKLSAIYSSPLKRAMDSALIISKACGINSVKIDDNLREIRFGVWEGLTFEQIKEKYPDLLDEWNTAPQNCVVPGAEPLCAVQGRIKNFIKTAIETHADETILVVSHSMPIKLIIADAINLPLNSMHNIRIENSTFSMIIYYDDHSVLKVMNDCSHLFGS